ncbi:unnamed protein product, partial [Mesorhabditis spiculigera]
GEITIHAARPVKVAGLHVRLFGLAETGWYNKNSELSFESRETVLDEPIDLTVEIFEHCNPEYELHDGLHKIDFEAQLPLDVVSSVEREGYGSVRYTCSAVLHLPEDGGSEFISEKTFKVWSLLNLDAPYLRESTSVTEEEEANGLVTCSYFFKLDLDYFDVVVPVILGSRKTPGPLD